MEKSASSKYLPLVGILDDGFPTRFSQHLYANAEIPRRNKHAFPDFQVHHNNRGSFPINIRNSAYISLVQPPPTRF